MALSMQQWGFLPCIFYKQYMIGVVTGIGLFPLNISINALFKAIKAKVFPVYVNKYVLHSILYLPLYKTTRTNANTASSLEYKWFGLKYNCSGIFLKNETLPGYT